MGELGGRLAGLLTPGARGGVGGQGNSTGTWCSALDSTTGALYFTETGTGLSSWTPPAGLEYRMASDGLAYTKEDFVAHYGGVLEWTAAAQCRGVVLGAAAERSAAASRSRRVDTQRSARLAALEESDAEVEEEESSGSGGLEEVRVARTIGVRALTGGAALQATSIQPRPASLQVTHIADALRTINLRPRSMQAATRGASASATRAINPCPRSVQATAGGVARHSLATSTNPLRASSAAASADPWGDATAAGGATGAGPAARAAAKAQRPTSMARRDGRGASILKKRKKAKKAEKDARGARASVARRAV